MLTDIDMMFHGLINSFRKNKQTHDPFDVTLFGFLIQFVQSNYAVPFQLCNQSKSTSSNVLVLRSALTAVERRILKQGNDLQFKWH